MMDRINKDAVRELVVRIGVAALVVAAILLAVSFINDLIWY